MVISTTLGGAAAFAVDRYDFRLSGLLGASYALPIMLPPIVISVAFLTFFYTIGIAGTIWSVLIAHGVFFAPFPFILISQGLSELDRGYEEASMSLGGTPWMTFRRVTYPLIRANVFAGAIFSFILSINEYVIAWILAGFTIDTIPIKIFSSLRYSYSPIIAAVSVVIVVLTVILTVLIDHITGGVWE
jgi:ABC-type spermidine/putrescine transport system permease subunit II